MKTLQQVEPRTPITNAPYTITQSGSYYLTTNLSSTGHGIVIRADRVTVDLMGFALTGDRGSSDYGVWQDGTTNVPVYEVVVRNGAIYGFGFGIHCEYGKNSRFEHLLVSSNYYSGVYLNGYNGQCNGNTVTDCAISDNRTYGVDLNGSYNGQCNGNTIADCSITGNGDYGVQLYGYNGQCNGNTLRDCTVRKNDEYGIFLAYADGNRIEGNHVLGQTGATTYGIVTTSSSQNMIFRNTCVGQTNNFSIVNTDTYGPYVTNTGALPSSGDAAHPWANFSR